MWHWRRVAEVLLAPLLEEVESDAGLGRPIAIGRIGLSRRGSIDEAVVKDGAMASVVMAGRESAQQTAALECRREPTLIMMCRS